LFIHSHLQTWLNAIKAAGKTIFVTRPTMSQTARGLPLGTRIFLLRVLAAVGSSAIFGLVATSTSEGIALLPAVLVAIVFGTAFVGGTGYRIIKSVWTKAQVASPASWSGAAAGSAIASILALAVWTRTEDHVARVLLGYSLAINFSYLCVKASCTLAGCCHADIRLLGRDLGLRVVEFATTVLILVTALTLDFFHLWLGALVGLLGHTLLRLYSRWRRGRWSTGWPPLRQPGAELAPLQLLCLIAITGLFLS
jgi:hypothetical protein